MSRCYLDTNSSTPTFVQNEGERLGRSRPGARVLGEIDTGTGVISALVLDELANGLVLAWLRDDGDGDPLSTCRADARKAMRATRRRLTATWRAVDSLGLELQATEHAVMRRANSLMSGPALAPRDAFHAAHALEARCDLIASSDAGFDGIPELRHLGP